MVQALAALDKKGDLVPFEITRRSLEPTDVQIAIDYCGICHSDIHYARDDWGVTSWPVVPGHEILGRVEAVGDAAPFKVGDTVAVGVLVDNCGSCFDCKDGAENYCNQKTSTYGPTTYGGYSKQIVVQKDWVFAVPPQHYKPGVAPLLCAGITSYAPLKHANVKGKRVGVAGLGGLGHLGVKLAKALGAHVTMITTSQAKAEDARRLGADEVLLSTDAEAVKASAGKFDFILNTIPVKHDVDLYLQLLRRDGELAIVGAIEPVSVHGGLLIGARRKVSGSSIGTIAETREMLDLCFEHGVTSDVEVIKASEVAEANERLLRGDVKYRFVLDIGSL